MSMSGPGGLAPTHWYIEGFLVLLNNPKWDFFFFFFCKWNPGVLERAVDRRACGLSVLWWQRFPLISDFPELVLQEPCGVPREGRGVSQALPATATVLPEGCGGGSTPQSSNERSHNQHRLKPLGQ